MSSTTEIAFGRASCSKEARRMYPQLAYRALQAEEKIGTMLPCNVILQQHIDGTVEVSAVDPVASMQAIENPELANVAKEVQAKLGRIISGL